MPEGRALGCSESLRGSDHFGATLNALRRGASRMSAASTQFEQLGGPVLRAVSRSFYLTIRLLPTEVRGAIGLAYLLARASDTIADSALASAAVRLAPTSLQLWTSVMLGRSADNQP